MAVDAWGFDSDRQAKAHRLRTLRFRLSIARTGALVSLVVGLVIVGSASLRDAVLSLRWPSWTSAILFLAVLYLAFFAVELPFTYVGGYRWEKASGLSSQSMWGWMKDLAKTAGLGLGASVVAGGVLLWLLATSTWWWLVAWLLGLIVSAILGFLAPVILVPLFYRFRPLTDAVLRGRFEALAAKADVPILGVFELRASEKTRRSNAAGMWLGCTRRVDRTDTPPQYFPPGKAQTRPPHGLAHQEDSDSNHGFVLGPLMSLS